MIPRVFGPDTSLPIVAVAPLRLLTAPSLGAEYPRNCFDVFAGQDTRAAARIAGPHHGGTRMRFLIVPIVLLGLGDPLRAAEPPPVRASLVRDLNTDPGDRSSSPSLFIAGAGRVFFAARTPAHGQELHATDVQGNARLLADIAPGPSGSLPEPVAVVGKRLVATANDGITGRQLWSVPVQGGPPVRLTSMGDNWITPPGTATVIASFGDRVMLQVPTQGHGVWTTDGTPGGTYRRDTASGLPLSVVVAGCGLADAAILAGTDTTPQMKLVRSTGVPGGDSVIAALPSGTWPTAAVTLGGACYFLLAGSPAAGWYLWRTDGTPEGSVQLASAADRVPSNMVVAGNAVYFLDSTDGSTTTPPYATRLLRLNQGATQPAVVVELPTPLPVSRTLQSHESRVLFESFAPGAAGFEAVLYASDGTIAGTRRLYPPPGQSGIGSANVHPVAGGVIVSDSYGSGDDVRIDLPGGTVTTVDTGSFDFGTSVLVDGVRIGRGGPAGGNQEVWMTAGTAGTTRLLNELWVDTASGVEWLGEASAIGDTLYFTHAFVRDSDISVNRVLWRSDGSEAGTTMLPRAQYSTESSVRKLLPYGNGGVMFSTTYPYGGLYYADAALGSAALVVPGFTDGFLQSTDNGNGVIYPCRDITALCGIHPASGGTVLAEASFLWATPIGQLGPVAVFATNHGAQEIWRSDGTPAGTFRLLTGRQLLNPVDEADLVVDGKMYFVSCTMSYACDLTVTDGTVAGTSHLLPMPTSGISWSARAGHRLVMNVGFGSAGQLWSTDGTVVGTQLLHDGDGSQFASTGDRVHMRFQCTGCKESRLVTDGTPAGTRLVSLPSGLADSGRFSAALGSEAVVFSCQNSRRGEELCVSDASGDATVALPEIFPGQPSSAPILVGKTASAVFFSADDGVHGRELWQVHVLADAVFADGFQ